jgi:hypothetical protein
MRAITLTYAIPRVMTVATTTKIQAFGDSLDIMLDMGTLAHAGFVRDDEVRVEATPDRVVITREDSGYAKAMDGFRKAAVRYPNALAQLAK